MKFPIAYPLMPLDRIVANIKATRKIERHDLPRNVRRRSRYISRARFEPGRLIRSLDELARQSAVYWNGRYTHIAWVKSWQLNYAINQIKFKRLRVIKEKEITK